MWAEHVGAMYAAWNERDLETALRHAHEDIEVRQDPGTPGAFSGVGRNAMRAWLEQFYETWTSSASRPKRSSRARTAWR